MWSASVYAVGGLLSVLAAANAFNSTGLPATSAHADKSASFEARWLDVAARKTDSLKSDRLDVSRPDASNRQAADDILFLTVPRAQTTVALKQAPRPAARNILIERHDGGGKSAPVRQRNIGSDMPVGCEPSFSPVTVPAMAHVSARCLS